MHFFICICPKYVKFLLIFSSLKMHFLRWISPKFWQHGMGIISSFFISDMSRYVKGKCSMIWYCSLEQFINSICTGSPDITLSLFFMKSCVKWNLCKVNISTIIHFALFFRGYISYSPVKCKVKPSKVRAYISIPFQWLIDPFKKYLILIYIC